MAVFVLDKKKNPLMPCSEKRAKKLLKAGRARVCRLVPFVIRLVDRNIGDSKLQQIKLNLNPQKKNVGIALVRERQTTEEITDRKSSITYTYVLNLFELKFRSKQISKALILRSLLRRRRRNALRYRAPRFLNRRTNKTGCLGSPSAQHRLISTISWVNRLQHVAPINVIGLDLMRFNLERIRSLDLTDYGYSNSTLEAYEIREYLLRKCGRKCAYCGNNNVPLQITYFCPNTKAVSNPISNLLLACHTCKEEKWYQVVPSNVNRETELQDKLSILPKLPLPDVGAEIVSRVQLYDALKLSSLPVIVGSVGQTLYNSARQGIPITDALYAACQGSLGILSGWRKPTLLIQSKGRGKYKRTRTDAYGFPKAYLPREKRSKGFQTGDMVKAVVTKGENTGTYVGHVTVSTEGYFRIQTAQKKVGLSHRYCKLIQRNNGYRYMWRTAQTSGETVTMTSKN